jgi:hypothetical protein
MAIFNIPCEGRPDLQVEGLKVANSVGVYHTLEVILSESGACVAVLRMEYGKSSAQFAVKTPNRDALKDWLVALDAPLDTPIKLVRDVAYNATRNGLDPVKVCLDLRERAKEVYVQIGVAQQRDAQLG